MTEENKRFSAVAHKKNKSFNIFGCFGLKKKTYNAKKQEKKRNTTDLKKRRSTDFIGVPDTNDYPNYINEINLQLDKEETNGHKHTCDHHKGQQCHCHEINNERHNDNDRNMKCDEQESKAETAIHNDVAIIVQSENDIQPNTEKHTTDESNINSFIVTNHDNGHVSGHETVHHSHDSGHDISSPVHYSGYQVSSSDSGHHVSSHDSGHHVSSHDSGHHVSSHDSGHHVSSHDSGHHVSSSDTGNTSNDTSGDTGGSSSYD